MRERSLLLTVAALFLHACTAGPSPNKRVESPLAAGFAQVPVVTLSVNLQVLNEQPGFEFDIKEYVVKAVTGMMFTDAISDMYHATAVRDLGRSDEAELLLSQAVADAERDHGAEHWTVCWLRGARGLCLTDLQRFAEAEVELRAAYECRQATLEDGHPLIGKARKRLVALYEAWGRPEQAESYRGE